MTKNTAGSQAHAHTYTTQNYLVGFGLSLVTTLLAFGVVMGRWFTDETVTLTVIIGLAIVQLSVQFVYFLHIRGREARWNRVALAFMAGVVIIIVGGSLWIMNNLDYHMMTPKQMESHMLEQGKKGF